MKRTIYFKLVIGDTIENPLDQWIVASCWRRVYGEFLLRFQWFHLRQSKYRRKSDLSLYEKSILLTKKRFIEDKWSLKIQSRESDRYDGRFLIAEVFFIFFENIGLDLRGVLNFSAKSIRRRICHVLAYACRLKF